MKDRIVEFLRDEAKHLDETAKIWEEAEEPQKAAEASYGAQLLRDEANFIEATFND